MIRHLTLLTVLLTASTVFSQSYSRRGRFGRPVAPLTEAEKQEAVDDLDELLAEAKRRGSIDPERTEHAVATVSKAAGALPPEELLAKLNTLQELRKDSVIPQPKKPLRKSQTLDWQILSTQVSALRATPAEQVTAHPCADGFPGPVPDDAQRVSRKIEIATDVPGWHNGGIYGNPGSPYWHSTGLYAAPGEVVTIRLPKSAVDKGLYVRIGCHSDRLFRKESWQRAPDICARYPITAEVTKAACAFGGLIYIETPRDVNLPKFTATIDGAVEAPRYIHGKTGLAAWRNAIRQYPAPWAELQTDKVILTLPSADVRGLDDPKELMDFWDRIMDCYAELLGRSTQRRRVERFVPDLQISAGYMHSGYPLMTMLDITSTMVDKQRMTKNGHHGVWGLFHEIGHNHQNRDWTFRGTTEVTVNLFSLYVMEKICGLPTGGHSAVTKESRRRKIERHFADGVPFDRWQSDPFLALAMYVQLEQEFGWDPFTKVFAQYRELPDDRRPKTDDQKRDRWLVLFSKQVGHNLGPFFEAWGVPTSEKARESIAELPEWMSEDLPQGKK